ncbi:MAG: nucleotidyltransferase family protein [Armatimonadota bacterium]|nr:nucleotidyltransferase family protein [Armatimonadota bacterium]MDR5697974.1 nucleotidyltransferase family protein [Armatimonadota bacterium]
MQAIILAGGKGERLRPFTEDRPKPMVEILGIPILGYQIQWLRAQDVTDIIIACGYRHEVIQDYFDDGRKWGVRIRYSIERDPLGRGGALKQAMAYVDDSVCLATNGDVITNVRIRSLMTQHRESGDAITIVLSPFISPYGIVDVGDDNKITGFHEKPELPYWINAGVYAINRDVRDLLPDQGDHETTTFPQLAEERRLGAFRSRAYWRGVDTIKDLSEVTKDLEQRLLSAFMA